MAVDKFINGSRPKRRSKNNGGGQGTSATISQPKGNKGKGKKNKDPFLGLNPPFDPRMRRIGSPLNQGSRMKRGWIQEAIGTKRVNYLFNPSQLDLSHGVDATVALNDAAAAVASGETEDPDPTNPWFTSTTGTLGIKLLYDRTYELFSPPKDDELAGLANKLGVYADVAAWYVFLDMLDEMPKTWQDTLVKSMPIYKTAYLFMGNRQVYYGWVNSIAVTYSHWNQFMIPARCAVDIGFTLLPHSGDAPARIGDADPDKSGFQSATSWADEFPDLTGIGGIQE